jgi:hypothetical protein
LSLENFRDDFDRNLLSNQKKNSKFYILHSPYGSKDRERQKMTNGSTQIVFSSTNGRGQKLVTTTTLSLFFAYLFICHHN